MPTCSEAGVLGAVTGVMGTLQATEVLKEILGIGESLSGRLLIWDALATRFRTVRLRRDPACPLCGPHATHQGPVAAPHRGRPCLRRLNTLGILLLSGAHDRAHYAFVLATGRRGARTAGRAVRHQRRLPRAARRLVGPRRCGTRRAGPRGKASRVWRSCGRPRANSGFA